jgi:MPBQ/MSBQ methyltransferase
VRVPPYFDPLIERCRLDPTLRSAHLGYWPGPVVPADVPASGVHAGQCFDRAQHRLDERLLALAQLRPGEALLDVGCGLGGTLEAINQREVRMLLCGLNIDPRQLDLCRLLAPRSGNRFHWVAGDACALPFADGRFDRLLCVEAMFHFASRRRFLREAARVLRPGGVLVASDLVVSPAARDIDCSSFPIRQTLDEGYGPWPDFWGEEGGHQALATEAGLRCTVLEDVSEQVRPSHRYTAPGGLSLPTALTSAVADAARRAALMLKWLHDEGHLHYMLLRLERPSR